MPTNPCATVLETNELVEMIAVLLSWSGLVDLSNINRSTRDVVHGLIRIRMRFFISKFIHWQDAPKFFRLLKATDAFVVGATVRCMLSVDTYHLYQDVNPLQLNLVVPYLPQQRLHENTTPEYRAWRRFFFGCGYTDEYGSAPGDSPQHLAATSGTWSVLSNDDFPFRRISIIQSRTRSALSPVLQTCHTSSFFALSSTRIYCLYPTLFAAKVNLNTKERMPTLRCALDSFNYGLISFTRTDSWGVFSHLGCGEACPSVWKRTKGLHGIGMFRWGGFWGKWDTGLYVSEPDACETLNEMWKVQGECCNSDCATIAHCSNLLQSIF